jgi:poly-gamma-glutamate synthesis protein (capsule biosynthesis protein)
VDVTTLWQCCDPGGSSRAPQPPRSLTVTAGGDILAEWSVRQAAAEAGLANGSRYDFTPIFSGVHAITEQSDLAICHMELPIGRPGQSPGVYGRSPFGGNLLLAPYELAAGASANAFDRCSTASNHSYDLGTAGIVSTLDALDAAGISHVGTARSPSEAAPSVFSVKGIRVGHLSYTRYSNTVQPRDAWLQSFAASPTQVANDVARLRNTGAEIVIVSMHLSQEMLKAPTATDRDFATGLTAAADIDLIVHHGPHVVQPVEMVNGTLVYWSVGNMVSGMGVAGQGRYEDLRTLDGLMATVRFLETSSGAWMAQPFTVGVCTDPHTRLVRAARLALSEPGAGLTQQTRIELEQCLARTEWVVGPVL